MEQVKKQKNDNRFETPRQILLVYASQTGTAKAFARKIYVRNTDLIDIVDMQHLSVADLRNYEYVIFIVSTYGNGEPPTPCSRFFNDLTHSSFSLSKTLFAILALGDKQFLHYCGFGNQLSHQLIQHQAIPRLPLTEVNRADAAIFKHWWSKLHETMGIQKEQDSETWSIATVMDKEDQVADGTFQFALYVRILENISIECLTVKVEQQGLNLNRIKARVISAACEPFIRVAISTAELGSKREDIQDFLVNSEAGDKWYVRVASDIKHDNV